MGLHGKAKNFLGVLSSLFNQSKNLRKRYPPASSTCRTTAAQELIERHYTPTSAKTLALDLGCGTNPRNPFQANELFGVDIQSDLARNISKADLSIEPIPFNDNTFDFCTAFDIIEHIPRNSYPQGKPRLAFLELMNEIHRILKPGGLLLHCTPAFPSKEAFQDPTHVNFITEDTMPLYFCTPHRWATGYGFNGDYELLEQRWTDNAWLIGLMRASK